MIFVGPQFLPSKYTIVRMDQKTVKITRISTSDPDFDASLELMHNSFPDDELRPDEDLKALTDSSNIFSFNIIKDENDERAGLITTWNFGKCLYVEHFAIEPSLRGHGLGSAAIAKIAELSKQPMILEVELPETSPEAVSRIAFYERLGFVGWSTPYVQPPYAKGKNSLPMMLMAKGLEETIEGAGIVTALLHRHVYGVKPPVRKSH